jgi:hypothetical protein
MHKRADYMSRQYPERIDINYLIDWAERKIIQMARSDRSKNFSTTAEFTRSITIFLNTMEMHLDPAESWLRRRISDTYYAMSGMRLNEEDSEKFTKFEEWLVDTLKFIVEYYAENGCLNQMMELSVERSIEDVHRVWHPPARWLEKHSGELYDLE